MTSRSRKSKTGIISMAWRNVWRNRRRSVITIGAMTLSMFVLILYTGLLEGYLQDLENNILDLEIGDLQIHLPGYIDKPSIHELIENPERILDNLKAKGFPASTRLLGGGLVAAEESSAGALLRGIDAEANTAVSQISLHIADGKWLDEETLGRRLARTINVKVGDDLIVLGQAADGTLANDIFHVRGILKGISDDTDRAGVYMAEEVFREFFAIPSGVHQIIVRRPFGVDLEIAGLRIEEIVPELDTRSWKELMPTLATLLESTQGIVQVMFFVVYIVVAILILNAMLMSVFERIREFGVLKAIGLSPRFVLSLILIESGFQALIAVVTGVLFSIPGLYYLTEVGIDTGKLAGMSVMGIAMTNVWRAIVTPYVFFGPISTLILMTFLATLYPAIKAAKISPVEAMRHQ